MITRRERARVDEVSADEATGLQLASTTSSIGWPLTISGRPRRAEREQQGEAEPDHDDEADGEE